MLLVILVIGVTQFTFAEELEKEVPITIDEEKFEKQVFIAVDEEEFELPKSTYSYQEVTVFGYVADYQRGQKVSIVITSPSESEEEINTYASKKGDIYTLLHFTSESQIGTYQISLIYLDVEIASTTLEILNNQ